MLLKTPILPLSLVLGLWACSSATTAAADAGFGESNASDAAIDTGTPDAGAQATDGCPILFRYPSSSGVSSVALHGDFTANGWAEGVALTQSGDHYETELSLMNRGVFRYKFVVNGSDWQPDPNNPHKEPDGVGGDNSVLIVDCGTDAALTVSFTTSATPNGRYAPRNVVALWIEDDAGTFVRTLIHYADKREKYLREWNAKSLDRTSIGQSLDVITGATRRAHGELSASWNLSGMAGEKVPDGHYVVRMELTDHNSNSAADNNLAGFPFDIPFGDSEQTGLSSGGFSNVTLSFRAQAEEVTEDPPSNPIDSCELFLECRDNDGCCAAECVYEVDNDCSPDTAQPVAGCATGGGSGNHASSLLFLLSLLFLRFREQSTPKDPSLRD